MRANKGEKPNRNCNTSTPGLDDLKCGQNLEIYSRVYRIVACDAFTRWYYEKNGIDAGQEEDVPEDFFSAMKRTAKEHEEKPTYTEVVEGQIYNEKVRSILYNFDFHHFCPQFAK